MRFLAVLGLMLLPSLALADTTKPVEEQGGVAIDGSTLVELLPSVLFNGETPKHGYLVCINDPRFGGTVAVSDVGMANASDILSAVLIPPASANGTGTVTYPCFVTPSNYRPSGPVFVVGTNGQNHIVARAW